MTAIQGSTLEVIVPKHSYATGSLKIKPEMWTKETAREVHERLQEITAIWRSQGTFDYLIYACKPSYKRSFSGYHIIPYPANVFACWQQLKILGRTIAGPILQNECARQQAARAFLAAKADYEASKVNFEAFKNVPVNQFYPDETQAETSPYADPFCDKDQLKKQLIFEGRHIMILASLSPLVTGTGQLHILFVPKKHCDSWDSLPKEAFVESEIFIYCLMNAFNEDEIHLMVKTGKRAGQTIIHCHLHFIIVSSQTSAFIGTCKLFKNILWGSSALSEIALADNVVRAKEMLKPVLEQFAFDHSKQ